MSYQAFITPLLTHFITTLPICLYNLPFQIWNKYQHWNDGSYVLHQEIPDADVIIFVHGRNGHSSSFTYLAENLKKLGIQKSMISVNLGPTGSTSVTQDSFTLHRLLQDFEQKIILVGLSKGGLIVSDYVATYGSNNVRSVITISSPLNGTLSADYFMPADHIARIELGYQSNFTQELKSRLPLDVNFFHIVPTRDHFIIPTSSASIEGPNHESKIYDGYYSHVDIAWDPQIAKYIANWVSKIC
jgi:triacylglycerol esterase/lipase EstA (alpha/beta hydrolase family)